MSTENTTIYKKLNEARAVFHAKKLTKSGHNKFANYTYFELSDFLLEAMNAFHGAGLCGLISFDGEKAEMTIVDVESGERTRILSPMSTAALKGCHEVQNLGAVQTYLRRYLWAIAIELVETSAVDASVKEEAETLPKDNFIAKKFPSKPRTEAPQSKNKTGWTGKISEVKTVEGESSKGPWKLFWVEMENGDSAGTFDEALANDARIMAGGAEVRVLVEPNVRKPGTWKYLGFEEVTQGALEAAGGEDLPWK